MIIFKEELNRKYTLKVTNTNTYALIYSKIKNCTKAVLRQIKDIKTGKMNISFIKEINCALLSIVRHKMR